MGRKLRVGKHLVYFSADQPGDRLEEEGYWCQADILAGLVCNKLSRDDN